MNKDIDMSNVFDKAKRLLDEEYDEQFTKWFEEEGYLDFIENTEDYMAQGVANYYMDTFIEDNE